MYIYVFTFHILELPDLSQIRFDVVFNIIYLYLNIARKTHTHMLLFLLEIFSFKIYDKVKLEKIRDTQNERRRENEQYRLVMEVKRQENCLISYLIRLERSVFENRNLKQNTLRNNLKIEE